jgi:hypothetical protein
MWGQPPSAVRRAQPGSCNAPRWLWITFALEKKILNYEVSERN